MFEQILQPQIEITRHHLKRLSESTETEEGKALMEALAELGTAVEELTASMEEVKKAEARVHQVESELAALRARVTEFYEFIPQPLLYTDAQGVILDANTAAASLLALPCATLKGKLLVTFVAPDKRRTFRTRLSHITSQDIITDWKVDIQPRTGLCVQLAARVGVQRDAAGRATHLRWLFENV